MAAAAPAECRVPARVLIASCPVRTHARDHTGFPAGIAVPEISVQGNAGMPYSAPAVCDGGKAGAGGKRMTGAMRI